MPGHKLQVMALAEGGCVAKDVLVQQPIVEPYAIGQGVDQRLTDNGTGCVAGGQGRRKIRVVRNVQDQATAGFGDQSGRQPGRHPNALADVDAILLIVAQDAG